MSRYLISPDPEVVVGWDPPLGEYFAHVYDRDGELLANIEGDLSDIDAFCMGYSRISDEILAQLVADRAKPWEPGPLQKALGFTGEWEETL